MSTPYSYLFIRTDLSLPQQIVQSAHAALEAGNRFGPHSHLVCFGVKTQDDLMQAASYLDRNCIEFQMFHESDDDTGFTSICTEPLQGDRRKPLKRFSLLREESLSKR